MKTKRMRLTIYITLLLAFTMAVPAVASGNISELPKTAVSASTALPDLSEMAIFESTVDLPDPAADIDVSGGNQATIEADLGSFVAELGFYSGDLIVTKHTGHGNDSASLIDYDCGDVTFGDPIVQGTGNGEAIIVPVSIRQTAEAQQITFTVSNHNGKTSSVTLNVPALAYEPVDPEAGLLVTLDKSVVTGGETFNATVSFAESVASNTAVLTYLYDKAAFSFLGFTPADGLTIVDEPVGDCYTGFGADMDMDAADSGFAPDTDIGVFKVVLANFDAYDLHELGTAGFIVNEVAILADTESLIQASVAYVALNPYGEKEIHTAEGYAILMLTAKPAPTGPEVEGDTNGDGLVNLIDLSNLIDWLGLDETHAEWDGLICFFDCNANGKIDIGDIAHIARLINGGRLQ